MEFRSREPFLRDRIGSRCVFSPGKNLAVFLGAGRTFLLTWVANCRNQTIQLGSLKNFSRFHNQSSRWPHSTKEIWRPCVPLQVFCSLLILPRAEGRKRLAEEFDPRPSLQSREQPVLHGERRFRATNVFRGMGAIYETYEVQ